MAPYNRGGARQERKAQRRRDDKRHAKRRQQRHDVRVRQRGQQAPFHAGQPEDRQEHQDDDDGGEDDGRADLDRRVAHDDRGRPALLRRQRRILPKPAHDVLDVDDRVVHERADGDRQPAERHRIDRHVEAAQHEDGGSQRQRHRRERDGRGARVGQKDQHDRDHQEAAVTQRGYHVVDGDLDEVGLPEYQPIDRDPRWQLLLQRVEFAVEERRDLNRVRARLLLHADDDRGRAVA